MAVVITLAATLVAGCSAASAPVVTAPSRVSPAGQSAASGTAVPSSVPRDYVMVDPVNPDHLLVRATITGAVVATVSAPRGAVINGVYGNGDGTVFAVSTRPNLPSPGGEQDWSLLRLGPGSAATPQLTQVPITLIGPNPTAVALSPDGREIAMAFTYRTVPQEPQPVRLYSTATGAVLRTWTVASGIIAAADPMANGDLGQEAAGIAMRWTADSRGLAYAFHPATTPGKDGYGYARNAAIWLLDTTAPGSDLMANSRLLSGQDPGYNPGNGASLQCLPDDGWSLSADGQGVTCASEWDAPSKPAMSCAHPPATALGFWRQFSLPDGRGGGMAMIYGACVASAPATVQLAWASPDGTTVLGILDYPGHSLFGLFSKGTFHALPAPPAGVPLASTAW